MLLELGDEEEEERMLAQVCAMEERRSGGALVWKDRRRGGEGREEMAYACFLLRRGRRGYMGLVLSVVTLCLGIVLC